MSSFDVAKGSEPGAGLTEREIAHSTAVKPVLGCRMLDVMQMPCHAPVGVVKRRPRETDDHSQHEPVITEESHFKLGQETFAPHCDD